MILLVVSAGGVVGALARYFLGLLVGTSTAAAAWSTVIVNLSGCLLIGLVLGFDGANRRPYLRPFLAVGVLGGYTTFSSYAMDAQRLLADGRLLAASLYLIGTLLGALVAVWAGLRLTGGSRNAALDSGAGEPR